MNDSEWSVKDQVVKAQETEAQTELRQVRDILNRFDCFRAEEPTALILARVLDRLVEQRNHASRARDKWENVANKLEKDRARFNSIMDLARTAIATVAGENGSLSFENEILRRDLADAKS